MKNKDNQQSVKISSALQGRVGDTKASEQSDNEDSKSMTPVSSALKNRVFGIGILESTPPTPQTVEISSALKGRIDKSRKSGSEPAEVNARPKI